MVTRDDFTGASRVCKIAKRWPMELQLALSYRVVGSMKMLR